MAAIAITSMTAFNAGVAIVATALAASDAHTLDVSDVKSDNFQILIENTSTNPGTITFTDGDFYSEGSQGDLAVAVAASSDMVICLESARFKTSAGLIAMGVAGSGFTGQAFASELP